MEERELVRLAKAGDTKAFAKLYEGIYKDLYRFALYTLKNVPDAEDAVSEAVMDGFASITDLRSDEAFRGWMFRILSVKCKKRLKEYVEKAQELSEDLLKEEEDTAEHMDVRRAFFRLDQEERMILSLHLFAGYRTWEIGKILNLNHNTVRSRESRALKKMEKLLTE